MNKERDENLFLQIIKEKILGFGNECKDGTLYLRTEDISPSELSKVINKPANDIVSFFWKKGNFVSINQPIPSDLLYDICHSFRLTVKKETGINFSEIVNDFLSLNIHESELSKRSPVVSIMGHIDHGKTTLLDTIRKTNLQIKEEGGITQKVSVSEVEFQGEKITFLDTPGHSDFIKMRERGISLTDIVVLVIDAKDGVMSQTEEIIKYINRYKLSVIVFINHKRGEETDNENNINRIRTQLQEKELNPIEWGGDAIVLSGSAKENKSINDLLENIIVMSDFKYHLTSNPSGVIIDSYLDKKTGWQVNELLIQSGVIKKKDCIFLNGKFGKIKILKDFNGEKAEEGKPGQIVQIVGLEQSAELGDKFLVINDKKIREEIKDELSDFCDGKKVIATVSLKNKKRKNLMIFSSTQNSLQAIVDLAKRKSSKDFSFNVAFSSVGSLNSHSLNLAKITESFIIFFGFFPSKETMNLMKENNIRYFSSNVIYELGDKLDEIISGNKEKIRYEKILGEALITNVFYFSKTGKIAGCKVVSGIISRNNNFRIVRKGKELFTGRIESLQSNKLNIKESRMGSECGIVFKDFENFKEGDKIIAFNIVEEDAK